MTARKRAPARRVAPPGWYYLQDAANTFGISPNTMTKWVAAGFVHTGHPDGPRALVSDTEMQRVQRLLQQQKGLTTGRAPRPSDRGLERPGPHGMPWLGPGYLC